MMHRHYVLDHCYSISVVAVIYTYQDRQYTAPNIDKEKGKFLLIFPGIMSFHKKPLSVATTTTTTTSTTNKVDDNNKKDKAEDDNGNDNDDDDDDVIVLDDDEEEEGKEGNATTKDGETSSQQQKTPAKKQSQTQSQPPPSLGKVEGLRTDHPTFTIPFPHLGKNLVFPGKKVPTSSKYIMLACSNKQKGSVQCKVCFMFGFDIVFSLSFFSNSSLYLNYYIFPILYVFTQHRVSFHQQLYLVIPNGKLLGIQIRNYQQ